MKEGTASHTARSVAARRLEYDRVAAPYGDPAADEALTGDVADGLVPPRDRMHEYIRARTAFFDRVVVSSIDRGVAQVVIGGAGYDGRAFRYAKPGVRWFEVDHPATQADKLERVTRLGLATPQVRFIPADFTADPVAEPLLAAGLDPARPALFLFEGVAVYLERPDNERVLAEFREVTTGGSLLAISVSVGGATSRTRASFQQRVAELGEPARTVLTFDQAADLLSAAGWKISDPSDRQRSAGLLLARATTAVVHSERGRLTPSPSFPPVAWQASAGPPAGRAAARRRPGGAAAQGTPPESPAALPLSALLSQALVAFTVEADNETEHRLPHRTQDYGLAPSAPPGAPWLTSLLMYANCLRHLPDAGITIAELLGRARTGTNLDGMRRWRYVTFTPDPGHGKRPAPDALIRPTPWGIEARDTWQAVTAEVESRWRDRLGAGAFDALRAALAGVGGTPGPAAARLPSDPRLRPVHQARPGRQGRGSASHRHAPCGFPAGWRPATVGAAFAAAARLRGTVRGRARPVARDQRQRPARADRGRRAHQGHPRPWRRLQGVRGDGHGGDAEVRRGDRGPRPGGRPVQGHPPHRQGRRAARRVPRAAPPTSSATGAPASATPRSTALRRALEPLAAGDPPRLFAGLEPYPDGWRARVPAPAALPHYPMTLHRGGYPDGS